MGGTNGPKETARVTTPVASNTLSVNVFTASGKAMVASGQSPSAKRSALTRSRRL
jgi:hypothetical protein